jgi:hypothetical protein
MRAHERLYAQYIQAAHRRWRDAVQDRLVAQLVAELTEEPDA